MLAVIVWGLWCPLHPSWGSKVRRNGRAPGRHVSVQRRCYTQQSSRSSLWDSTTIWRLSFSQVGAYAWNVGFPGSNDHITGSVATPANGNGSLPVIVWIHGFVYSSQSYAFWYLIFRGAYLFGGAYQFNGEDLIRHSGGNAVVVVLQWRMGVFGFLSGSKVRDGGVLNAGLRG